MLSRIFSFLLLAASCFAFELPNLSPADPHSPIHFNLGRIQGKGIGYKKSYSSFELLLTPNLWEQLVPFVDLKGHYFDDGKWAINGGSGVRYLSDDCSSILGAGLYYDFRETTHTGYHQIGIATEWLTNCFELRLNGYIPVGKNKSQFFNRQFTGFNGHNFILSKKREFSLGGADFEAGYRLFLHPALRLYGGLGSYFLSGDHRFATGIKGCLSANFLRFFTLDVLASYDHLFHTKVQGQLTFSIPLGGKTNCAPIDDCGLERLMYQPIARRDIIAVDREKKRVAVTDPLTGDPLNFIFVNNSNLFSGNGTFEDPFNSLKQAEITSSENSIIYVYEGDGTDNGMNAGIILKDRQRLLGSGIPQMIPSSEGIIFLPAETASFPTISNNTGSAVELANDNQVIGFNLTARNWAIHGKGIVNTSLANNNIEGALLNGGIGLQDVLGKAIVNFNVIKGTSDSGHGIAIESGNSDLLEAHIQGNEITYFTDGITVISKGQAAVNSQIQQNLIALSRNYGIYLESLDSAPQTSFVLDNNVYNGFKAIDAKSASHLDLTIAYNQLNSNGRSGIEIVTEGGSAIARVNNNNLLDILDRGVIARTTTLNDVLYLQFNNNFVNGPIEFFNAPNSIFYIEPLLRNWGFLTISGSLTEVPSTAL